MKIWTALRIFIFDGRPNHVQNADIRVVILILTYHDPLFSTPHKTTHPRTFTFNPDWPDPEEEALCSEAPDKDALIRHRGCVLLSVK